MSVSGIERIVYFGDSFTDTGVIHDITGRVLVFPVPPASYGYAGQFTNGEVYADIAPRLLGLDSENYAAGGARAVGSRTIQDFINANVGNAYVLPGANPADLAFDTNLTAQMDRFLTDEGPGGVARGTAASFFIGLNDYANFVPTSPATALAEATALVQAVIGSTAAAAGRAVAAGVDTVILHTLPSFRIFPTAAFATPEQQALGDAVTAAHNAGLAAAATQLQALGVHVEIVDTNLIGNEVLADASTFGFRADLFSQPALFGTGGDPTVIDLGAGPVPFFAPNPAVAGVDADQIAFWDLFHPSAALHGVLGAFTSASLSIGLTALTDQDDTFTFSVRTSFVMALGGDDTILTGEGNDIVFGGLGDDEITLGFNEDIGSGGSGDDILYGRAGNDVLAGGDGDDVLRGGTAGDLLIAGQGNDLVRGGRGADAFVFVDGSLVGGTDGADTDRFVGGKGYDILYLVLSDPTRAGTDIGIERPDSLRDFTALGLTARGIEEVVILTDRSDLATIPTAARIGEADLWGLI